MSFWGYHGSSDTCTHTHAPLWLPLLKMPAPKPSLQPQLSAGTCCGWQLVGIHHRSSGMPCKTGFMASCVLFFQLTAMPYARRPRPPRSILNLYPQNFASGAIWIQLGGKATGNVKSGSLENHTFQWCIGVMTEPLVTGARGSCWPPSSLGAGDLPCYTVHFRSLQSSSLWILSSALY